MPWHAALRRTCALSAAFRRQVSSRDDKLRHQERDISAVFQSLRGRLVLLLLLVFVPAAVLMALTHLQEREFLSDQTERTLRRIARLVVMKEETVIGGAQALVIALAKAGYVLQQDHEAGR